MKLEVRIGKLRLKNPVMAASGTFGEDYARFVDIDSLGAYVTKTITLGERAGNPPPRIAETASGMLNSIGLENKGLEDFIENTMPFLRRLKTAVIVSVAGNDEDEFRQLAKALNGIEGLAAIELNLSCPNIRYGSRDGLIAQDEEATCKAVEAVRRATDLTVIAKLSPSVTSIKRIAKAAERGGADGLTLVNTFLAMSVDIEKAEPRLGNVTGGLSGPAIKPIALRMVWEAFNAVKVPIIGSGGIMDYRDAVEFILCGARALQVGTANFVNPTATIEVIDGLKRYLAKRGIDDIGRLVGGLKA